MSEGELPWKDPETRVQWECRTGRRLTWDDILTDDEDPACMMCGSKTIHSSETDGFTWGVEPGTLWTYCRPCDTWTEHPPRYREPDAKRAGE